MKKSNSHGGFGFEKMFRGGNERDYKVEGIIVKEEMVVEEDEGRGELFYRRLVYSASSKAKMLFHYLLLSFYFCNYFFAFYKQFVLLY